MAKVDYLEFKPKKTLSLWGKTLRYGSNTRKKFGRYLSKYNPVSFFRHKNQNVVVSNEPNFIDRTINKERNSSSSGGRSKSKRRRKHRQSRR
jgi:hypothetical protein